MKKLSLQEKINRRCYELKMARRLVRRKERELGKLLVPEIANGMDISMVKGYNFQCDHEFMIVRNRGSDAERHICIHCQQKIGDWG